MDSDAATTTNGARADARRALKEAHYRATIWRDLATQPGERRKAARLMRHIDRLISVFTL